MGNTEAIQANISEYKSHPRLGVYRLIQQENYMNGKKDSEFYLEVKKQIPNEKIYNSWAETIKGLKLSLDTHETILLPIKHSYQLKSMCGSAGILYMVFEQVENSLKQQINSRRRNQSPYTEQQIWLILLNLVRAGILYQSQNKKIGDLHPSNIMLTHEGIIKIITRDSMPFQLTNFEKIVQTITADVYLAPEEMEFKMIQSGVCNLKDPSKADVFSLGVTILQAITLQNCQYLYIRNPMRLSHEKLNIYITKMRQKYSPFLHQIVINCLEINPKNRKGFLELYQTLKLYEHDIDDLVAFTPYSPKNRQSGIRSNQSIGNNLPRSLDQSQSITNKSFQNLNQTTFSPRNIPFSPPTQQYFGFSKRI